jgi:hypothetical protein
MVRPAVFWAFLQAIPVRARAQSAAQANFLIVIHFLLKKLWEVYCFTFSPSMNYKKKRKFTKIRHCVPFGKALKLSLMKDTRELTWSSGQRPEKPRRGVHFLRPPAKADRKPGFPAGSVKRLVIFLVFIVSLAVPLFPDEETDRLLHILDDVLKAASEIENPLPPPRPEGPGFYLLNKTGFTIREVYIRRTGENEWGTNLIQAACYKGQTVFVSFTLSPDAGEQYSIRVVDVDGDYYSKYDLTIDMFATVEMSISDYGQ